MLGINEKFPEFSLTAVVSNEMPGCFKQVDSTKCCQGDWRVIFFWPKDFTFVCPTELIEFNKYVPEFAKRNAKIIGVSIDSDFVHLAWRNQHPGLKNLDFPMLSDIKRELVTKLGILNSEAGVAERALYLVDPKGIIRFVYVTDLKVGRNVNEVLRVLDALQTDQLCGCGWQKGDAPIK